MTRLATSLLVIFSLSACKQGVGERCQVQSDCDDGLICTTQGFCDTSQGETADAAPDPDVRPDAPPPADGAPLPDVSPLDASNVDASSVDAAPVDASTVDVAL